MSKYRRIEVNAYRRRVTVISGVWPRDDTFEAPAAETDDGVSLSDSDVCEPIEPDSPEGQLMLVEAVHSLDRRLLPETRAMISADWLASAPNDPNETSFSPKSRRIYGFIRRVLSFRRKEKTKCGEAISINRDSA